MADRWKSLHKKWTLKEAREMSPFSVLRMPLAEKAELAQFYYRQFNLRVNTYANALTVPFAFSKLVGDFENPNHPERLTDDQLAMTLESPVVISKSGKRQLAEPFASMENPNAALNRYVMRMQSFFNAKTATVAGWKEVGLEQDKALFGVDVQEIRKYRYEIDENGKRRRKYYTITIETPKYTMNDAERIKLWAIIDMAKDAGWLNRFGYSSEQAHRQIASLWMRGELDHYDIDAAYAKITSILDEKRAMRIRYKDESTGDTPFVPVGGGENTDGRSDQSDLLSQHDSLLQ